jgi:hypothetical protein
MSKIIIHSYREKKNVNCSTVVITSGNMRKVVNKEGKQEQSETHGTAHQIERQKKVVHGSGSILGNTVLQIRMNGSVFNEFFLFSDAISSSLYVVWSFPGLRLLSVVFFASVVHSIPLSASLSR